MWGYGPDWGMMHGWSGGSWAGPFGMIIWILFLVLIIAAVVWFVRSIPHAGNGQLRPERRSLGLDVLEERYAKGEIQRDEYLQKKRDLGG